MVGRLRTLWLQFRLHRHVQKVLRGKLVPAKIPDNFGPDD